MIAILLSGSGAFAQGDFGDPADTNPTDAPIGDYIWILGIVGLIYVFYKMKTKVSPVR